MTVGIGAAEMVEESGGGAVVPGDPKGFAAMVAGLLYFDEGLAVMGAAGAAYARERLSWNSIARRFGDLYIEMPHRNWASH